MSAPPEDPTLQNLYERIAAERGLPAQQTTEERSSDLVVWSDDLPFPPAGPEPASVDPEPAFGLDRFQEAYTAAVADIEAPVVGPEEPEEPEAPTADPVLDAMVRAQETAQTKGDADFAYLRQWDSQTRAARQRYAQDVQQFHANVQRLPQITTSLINRAIGDALTNPHRPIGDAARAAVADLRAEYEGATTLLSIPGAPEEAQQQAVGQNPQRIYRRYFQAVAEIEDYLATGRRPDVGDSVSFPAWLQDDIRRDPEFFAHVIATVAKRYQRSGRLDAQDRRSGLMDLLKNQIRGLTAKGESLGLVVSQLRDALANDEDLSHTRAFGLARSLRELRDAQDLAHQHGAWKPLMSVSQSLGAMAPSLGAAPLGGPVLTGAFNVGNFSADSYSNEYHAARRRGLDHQDAITIAAPVSLAIGAVEALELRILKGATKQVANTRMLTRQQVAEFGRQWLVGTGSEIGEEGVQSIIHDVGVNVGYVIDGTDTPNHRFVGFRDMLDNSVAQQIEAAPSCLLMAGMFSGAGTLARVPISTIPERQTVDATKAMMATMPDAEISRIAQLDNLDDATIRQLAGEAPGVPDAALAYDPGARANIHQLFRDAVDDAGNVRPAARRESERIHTAVVEEMERAAPGSSSVVEALNDVPTLREALPDSYFPQQADNWYLDAVEAKDEQSARSALAMQAHFFGQPAKAQDMTLVAYDRDNQVIPPSRRFGDAADVAYETNEFGEFTAEMKQRLAAEPRGDGRRVLDERPIQPSRELTPEARELPPASKSDVQRAVAAVGQAVVRVGSKYLPRGVKGANWGGNISSGVRHQTVVRDPNSLSTLAHEVGHKIVNLQPKLREQLAEHVDELAQIIPWKFDNPADVVNEGLAEAVYGLIVNPEKTNELAPNVVQTLRSELPSRIWLRLEDARHRASRWLSASEAEQAAIGIQNPPDPSLVARLKTLAANGALNVQRALQNRLPFVGTHGRRASSPRWSSDIIDRGISAMANRLHLSQMATLWANPNLAYSKNFAIRAASLGARDNAYAQMLFKTGLRSPDGTLYEDPQRPGVPVNEVETMRALTDVAESAEELQELTHQAGTLAITRRLVNDLFPRRAGLRLLTSDLTNQADAPVLNITSDTPTVANHVQWLDARAELLSWRDRLADHAEAGYDHEVATLDSRIEQQLEQAQEVADAARERAAAEVEADENIPANRKAEARQLNDWQIDRRLEQTRQELEDTRAREHRAITEKSVGTRGWALPAVQTHVEAVREYVSKQRMQIERARTRHGAESAEALAAAERAVSAVRKRMQREADAAKKKNLAAGEIAGVWGTSDLMSGADPRRPEHEEYRSALAALDQLEQHPKYDSLAEYNRRERLEYDAALKYARDAGRLSHEAYTYISQNNLHYASMARVLDAGVLPQVPNLADEYVRTSAERLTMGEDADHAHLQLNRELEHRQALAGHDVLGAIADSAQPGGIGTTREVLWKFRGSRKAIKNLAANRGLIITRILREADANELRQLFVTNIVGAPGLATDPEMDISSIIARIDRPPKNAAEQEQTLVAHFAGEPTYWHIADPALARELKMSYESRGWWYRGPVRRMMPMMKSLLQVGVIKSARFIKNNITRDTAQRWALTSVPWSKRFQREHSAEIAEGDFELYGGAVSFYSLQSQTNYVKMQRAVGRELLAENTEGERRNLILDPRRLAATIARGYWNFPEATEQWGRKAEFQAVYNRLRNQGVPIEDAKWGAAFEARDLMDFNRSGWMVKEFLAPVIPFLNPAIQGTSKTWRTTTGHLRYYYDKNGNRLAPDDPRTDRSWRIEHARWLTKRAAALTATYTLVEMIAGTAARYGDYEEELEQQPQYRRDLFWGFRLGDGAWIWIPKGHEAARATAFTSRALRWVRATAAEDPEAQHRALNVAWAVQNLAAIGMPVEFSAFLGGPLKSLVEVQVNYDAFREKAVVPEHGRYEAWTYERGSRLGQVTARGLNVSKLDWLVEHPMEVDHVVKGQFGHLGRAALDASDLWREDRPNTGLIDWVLFHGLDVHRYDPSYSAVDIQRVFRLSEVNNRPAKETRKLRDLLSQEINSDSSDRQKQLRRQAYAEAQRILQRYDRLQEQDRLDRRWQRD